MKKITALLVCVLLVASMLTGCFGGSREFTCQDLTMSVPGGMRDVSSNSDYSQFTFTLDSSKVAIFGLREKFSDFDGQDMSVKEYAEAVIKANNHNSLAIQRSNEDYYYFTYEAKNADGAYKYVAGCFKGKDAFWLVQIAAKVTDFELETYLSYLDSVELN